jgi:hypothetical protein
MSGESSLNTQNQWDRESWDIWRANSPIYEPREKSGITRFWDQLLFICDAGNPESYWSKKASLSDVHWAFSWHVWRFNAYPRWEKCQAVRLFLPENLLQDDEWILQGWILNLFLQFKWISKSEPFKNKLRIYGKGCLGFYWKDVWNFIFAVATIGSKNWGGKKYDGFCLRS